MSKPSFPVILFFSIFVVFFARHSVFADCRAFSNLIQNGGYAVSGPEGRLVSACNENNPLVPASIIKIPLALSAFEILGPEFRFVTELYMDEKDNLYIKGYGDPFLISEEVGLIIDQLKDKGVKTVNGIYVDNSSYALTQPVPGRSTSDNPYDVPVSPVAVNFNTVSIQVLGDGSVVSAEPQTPTLPLMQELGRSFPPGEYRINICLGGCSEEEQSSRYTLELFRALLEKKSIHGKGDMAIRKVPVGANRLYVHKNTKKLEDIVFSFLKYSNNFVANQVFLRCGVAEYGFPANWEKARAAVSEALSRLLGPEISRYINIDEGSGLSRKNRVTATAMLRVLEKFKPYAFLLQEKTNVSIKSGTLKGVYNYAGYFPDGKPFVILLNQERNTRDKLMQSLRNLNK